MPLSPHTKSALSGALGATLALVLLVGTVGASERGAREGREVRARRGFAHQVLRRLDRIDRRVRALRADVETLTPKIDQLQGQLAGLAPAVDQVQAQLAALAPKIDEVQTGVVTLTQAPGGGGPAAPTPVFGLQICLKAGVAGEIGFSGEQQLKIEGQGRVGAEAYGNGVMAHIRAIPGAKVGGGVKGDAAGELTACFDLRALAQRIRSNTVPFPMTPGQEQAVLRMDATDQPTLAGRLLDFAALTNLEPDAVGPALDTIPLLAADVDPIRMAEPGNAVTALAQSVPMSFQARARIQDVNATFDTFEQQAGQLCTASLPPGLAKVVDPVCVAAANEPLKTAIENTATRVTDVRSRVISVQQQIAAIPGRVRNALCAVLPGC